MHISEAFRSQVAAFTKKNELMMFLDLNIKARCQKGIWFKNVELSSEY